MEATISRMAGRQLEIAAADWLHATRRLLSVLARRTGYALGHYSRAAILLRGGHRTFRRL